MIMKIYIKRILRYKIKYEVMKSCPRNVDDASIISSNSYSTIFGAELFSGRFQSSSAQLMDIENLQCSSRYGGSFSRGHQKWRVHREKDMDKMDASNFIR